MHKNTYIFPRVVVFNSVLEAMAKEVLDHPTIETAWGMYGLVYTPVDPTKTVDIIVTGIIPPSISDIVRGLSTTKLGGQHQAMAVAWLQRNFALASGCANDSFNVKLAYLFKGHSHHQLGYKQYSGTDRTSMKQAVADGLEYAVGPLALIEKYQHTPSPEWKGSGEVVLVRKETVEFKFYFFSRKMVELGMTEPVEIRPVVIPENLRKIFYNVPLSWQFSNEVYFQNQMLLLHQHGCSVQVVSRKTTDDSLFEQVQLLVDNPKWAGNLNIITPWNFPTDGKEPMFEVTLNKKDLFSEVKTFSGEVWNYGDDLLASIVKLEERGVL